MILQTMYYVEDKCRVQGGREHECPTCFREYAAIDNTETQEKLRSITRYTNY